MKAVLQRVKGGSVSVDGRMISSIGPGIVALIGIGTDDTMEDVGPLCNKMVSLKLWNEGQTASSISVPPQYLSSSSTTTDSTPTTSPTVTDSSTPVSRQEQVWGGKPWKSSLQTFGGEILCVSQFTLHAQVQKGSKPDFHKSMAGSQAKVIYDAVLEKLASLLGSKDKVKDGAFGEMMDVSLTNDGPVTILLDTREKK
ncbi:unnamed protein product [Sympodiomycopsis kandeliae]